MADVVVVDNDPLSREIMWELIGRLGHVAHCAVDGEQGLALIRTVRPALVCSDVDMPKINGHQLKVAIDRCTALEGTWFVFVSGRASKVDIADGLMLGAHAYFTKPLELDRFSQFVEMVTQAGPARDDGWWPERRKNGSAGE